MEQCKNYLTAFCAYDRKGIYTSQWDWTIIAHSFKMQK